MNGYNNDSRLVKWWKTDAHEAVGWALIFLWAASILFFEVSGAAADVAWWDGWALFFLGLGIIVLTGTVVRRIIIGRSIEGFGAVCGVFMVAGGVDGLVGVEWIWPVALGAVGVLILIYAVAFPRYEDDVYDWE